MAICELTKVGQVFWYIPGNSAVLADDTVSGDCCDEFYIWWHFGEGTILPRNNVLCLGKYVYKN